MKLYLLIGLGFLSALGCRADELSPPLAWRTDFPAAQADAAQQKRAMLLNFTGSDWCVWCHRIRDEIFNTPAFAAYAAEALVLVELDFPRRKSLPPELKKQNDALAEKFGVNSYPTILLLSPDGKVLTRLGYMQGGPKTFVRELKRQIAGASGPAAAK